MAPYGFLSLVASVEACNLSTPQGSEFAFILLLGDPDPERFNGGSAPCDPEAILRSAPFGSGFPSPSHPLLMEAARSSRI